jgi:glutamine synthetase
MLKRLIKNVAEKHGLAATFMAKPYSAWTGSGMHIHVSLGDEDGNNLFAAEDPRRTSSSCMRSAGSRRPWRNPC